MVRSTAGEIDHTGGRTPSNGCRHGSTPTRAGRGEKTGDQHPYGGPQGSPLPDGGWVGWGASGHKTRPDESGTVYYWSYRCRPAARALRPDRQCGWVCKSGYRPRTRSHSLSHSSPPRRDKPPGTILNVSSSQGKRGHFGVIFGRSSGPRFLPLASGKGERTKRFGGFYTYNRM